MSIAKNVEVYTKKGWTPISSCPETTEIYGMNKNKEISFKEINSIEPVWQDTMTYIHNKRCDFQVCTSKDHTFLVTQANYKPIYKTMDEFNTNTKFIRTGVNNQKSPKTYNVNGLEMDIEDFIFLSSWYVSEGYVTDTEDTVKRKRYNISITQKEEDNYNFIKENLIRITDKYDLRLWICKDQFVIPDKRFYDYFLPFGKSHDKYVPGVIFKCSEEHIKQFLNYYVMGDGYISKTNGYGYDRISTSSLRLVSGLSGLIILTGSYPGISLDCEAGSIYNINGKTGLRSHDCYNITVNTTKNINNTSCIYETIDYNDNAYNIDTPHDGILIRYDGKTCFI